MLGVAQGAPVRVGAGCGWKCDNCGKEVTTIISMRNHQGIAHYPPWSKL